jgi:hypothetical protein
MQAWQCHELSGPGGLRWTELPDTVPARRQVLLPTVSTLNTFLRMVATLGGFLGRKRDGEPGLKTLWIGTARLADFATGVRYAGEMGLA